MTDTHAPRIVRSDDGGYTVVIQGPTQPAPSFWHYATLADAQAAHPGAVLEGPPSMASFAAPDWTGTLTRAQRADVVTARQTILRAVSGHEDVDLPAAAAMLDRVLDAGCPHDPASRVTAPDTDGRSLTTCHACGVSWFAAPA